MPFYTADPPSNKAGKSVLQKFPIATNNFEQGASDKIRVPNTLFLSYSDFFLIWKSGMCAWEH